MPSLQYKGIFDFFKRVHRRAVVTAYPAPDVVQGDLKQMWLERRLEAMRVMDLARDLTPEFRWPEAAQLRAIQHGNKRLELAMRAFELANSVWVDSIGKVGDVNEVAAAIRAKDGST